VLSLAGHAAAVGLVLWLAERAVMPPPPDPEPMVYIESAPPPPPPLGVPGKALKAPVAVKPAARPSKEIARPQRLVAPRKAKRAVAPAPLRAPLPAGVPDGSVAGIAGGVLGGDAGGKLGGVVGGHGDEPIPTSRLAHPPIVISRVLPVYPRAARSRGVEGRVVLRAVITRDGRVEHAVTVLESADLFDTAAVEALRQWRFKPGRDREGKPVRVLIEVPMRFQLRQ